MKDKELGVCEGVKRGKFRPELPCARMYNPQWLSSGHKEPENRKTNDLLIFGVHQELLDCSSALHFELRVHSYVSVANNPVLAHFHFLIQSLVYIAK